MNRRAYLGAATLSGFIGLAGCLQPDGGDAEIRGEYRVDAENVQPDYECQQQDLFDDQLYLNGRAVSVLIGTSTAEWHIDLPANKDLMIGIYGIEQDLSARVPNLQLTDPDDEILINERSPSTLHAITTETDGVYTLRLWNPEWTTRHRWRVEVTWYDDTGCTRFTRNEERSRLAPPLDVQ